MPYPEELIREIATRHGLHGEVSLMPEGGMVNEAWAIGDSHVLRIVRDGRDAECDDEAEREGVVVPLLVAAGIRTPRLVAFDAAHGPRPYTIYERVNGELIGFSKLPHEKYTEAWRQVGRELHTLHSIEVSDDLRPHLRESSKIDVPKWVGRTLEKGAISQEGADDVLATASRLEEIGGPPAPSRMIHEDIHPWNLMGEPSSGELAAIIDWGDATYGDPARDFAAMPLPCVPEMVAGYREAGGTVDAAFIARSILAGLNVALWEARTPEMSAFVRHWWRMPFGGWPEMKSLIQLQWPGHID